MVLEALAVTGIVGLAIGLISFFAGLSPKKDFSGMAGLIELVAVIALAGLSISAYPALLQGIPVIGVIGLWIVGLSGAYSIGLISGVAVRVGLVRMPFGIGKFFENLLSGIKF